MHSIHLLVITHAHNYGSQADRRAVKIIQWNEGGGRDVRLAKMIETRNGLVSNPVPTSIFAPQKGNSPFRRKGKYNDCSLRTYVTSGVRLGSAQRPFAIHFYVDITLLLTMLHQYKSSILYPRDLHSPRARACPPYISLITTYLWHQRVSCQHCACHWHSGWVSGLASDSHAHRPSPLKEMPPLNWCPLHQLPPLGGEAWRFLTPP